MGMSFSTPEFAPSTISHSPARMTRFVSVRSKCGFSVGSLGVMLKVIGVEFRSILPGTVTRRDLYRSVGEADSAYFEFF